MTNLIKETIQAEIASLQAQLDLIEKQAERLQKTLATYHNLLEEDQEVEVELVYEEEEVPELPEDLELAEDEVEIELIYAEKLEDEADAEEELIEEPEVETPYIASPEVPEDSEAPAEEELVEEEPVVEESIEGLDASEDSDVQTVVEEPVAEKLEVKTATTTSLLTPIDDLRKGMSLGDRFLFQRELFGGNGELMTKTLDKLNEMESFEEAGAYITKHFTWDKDTQAFELFVNLLKRRW